MPPSSKSKASASSCSRGRVEKSFRFRDSGISVVLRRGSDLIQGPLMPAYKDANVEEQGILIPLVVINLEFGSRKNWVSSRLSFLPLSVRYRALSLWYKLIGRVA